MDLFKFFALYLLNNLLCLLAPDKVLLQQHTVRDHPTRGTHQLLVSNMVITMDSLVVACPSLMVVVVACPSLMVVVVECPSLMVVVACHSPSLMVVPCHKVS